MKKSVTVTRSQYEYIKDLLSKHCLAVAEQKVLEYLFNVTDITKVKYGYCSNEWKATELVTMAIFNNAKYVNVVEN